MRAFSSQSLIVVGLLYATSLSIDYIAMLHIWVENGVSALVFDLSGRLAKQISITGLITVLPVSDLSSGEYIVEIQTTEGTGVFKLIKK